MRRFRRGRRGVTFMRYSFTSEAIRRGCRGASGKPPCFSAGIFIPRGVFRQLRPEGDWGKRREARAQWAQPPKAVSDPEFRQTTSGAHGSAGRADCLPRGKPPAGMTRDNFAEEIPLWRGLTRRHTGARGGLAALWGARLLLVAIRRGCRGASGKPPCIASIENNFAVSNSPWRGMTRRLRRGGRACSPMGRSHFSFGGERKVCKRKPAARRLREKALYCPFLKEGVRNVARSTVERSTLTFVRARAHSFPLSKRARLFPSAAYRRSAPPQSAWGILTPCGLDVSV